MDRVQDAVRATLGVLPRLLGGVLSHSKKSLTWAVAVAVQFAVQAVWQEVEECTNFPF